MREYQSKLVECEDCGYWFSTVMEDDGYIRDSYCESCWASIEAMADLFCPVPEDMMECYA